MWHKTAQSVFFFSFFPFSKKILAQSQCASCVLKWVLNQAIATNVYEENSYVYVNWTFDLNK